MKIAGGDGWDDLQEKYRYTGIVDRLLKNNPAAVALKHGQPIPAEYMESAKMLTPKQKDGIYHYSNHSEGVRMNQHLGGVPGVNLAPVERINLENTSGALNNMSLPFDTVVWRGADPETIKGFAGLEPLPAPEWRGKTFVTDSFTSTSIFRDTSYEKKVQMIVLVPKSTIGAGYINEISYNKANYLNEEFEILLQKGSAYDILKVQKFNGKVFLVARWLGYA